MSDTSTHGERLDLPDGHEAIRVTSDAGASGPPLELAPVLDITRGAS